MHLGYIKQQNVASQKNTSTLRHDPQIRISATQTQYERKGMLSHSKWIGCNCLKENVQKCVLIFMSYLTFYAIAVHTDALNSKTA